MGRRGGNDSETKLRPGVSELLSDVAGVPFFFLTSGYAAFESTFSFEVATAKQDSDLE